MIHPLDSGIPRSNLDTVTPERLPALAHKPRREDETEYGCADRENNHRPGHYGRGFMGVRILLRRHVRLAVENLVQFAEDVNACEICGEDPGSIAVGGKSGAGRKDRMEHCVMRLRSGERPEAAERERADPG